MKTASKILVSACLIGQKVRYDGAANESAHPVLLRWLEEERVVPLCPECAGGLPVPRPPAEIVGGVGLDVVLGQAEVRTRDADVSEYFLKGAQSALARCQELGITVALLKARSPSCGSSQIYDGSFSRTLKEGEGVTTALLRHHGIKVFSEEEFELADQALGR